VRTYFDTLLFRKRSEYGPLWLFELDSDTWAIIWDQCLEDEDTCRLVLSEDPNWFNQEWTRDGRRPNPTYSTLGQALEEIIRLLTTMLEALGKSDVRRSHYSAYLALAEYHFHSLEAEERVPMTNDSELLVPDVGIMAQLSEAQQAFDLAQLSQEPGRTPPAPAPAALATKKPWEVASGDPTAINFRPDMSLHAKMEWVCENVPKMSRLRILREGAELLCKMLIEKHYRHQE